MLALSGSDGREVHGFSHRFLRLSTCLSYRGYLQDRIWPINIKRLGGATPTLSRPIQKNLKTLGQLLSLFRIYPWSLPALIALGIASSLTEGFGISLFIPFLHGLGQTSPGWDTGIWFSDRLTALFAHIPPEHRLMVIAASIFASILLKALLSFCTIVLYGWLGMHITHQLRCRIFSHLMKVEYGFVEGSPSGKQFNTLSTETWRTSDALTVLVQWIVTGCMIAVYGTILLLISWKLTVMVIIFMGLLSLVIRLLTRRVKEVSADLTHSNALMSKSMVQSLDGMKVVRAFGRESYEQNRFARISERISQLLMRLMVAAGLVNPVYEVLAGGLLVYVLLTTLQTSSGLTPLLVFIFVLYRLQPKIMEFDEHRIKLHGSAASVEDVMSLFRMKDPSYPVSGKIVPHGLKKGIRIARVQFSYGNSQKPALNNVSLFVRSGETTALVGPSGGGKSTLIKLILRLYDPTEGHIFADDHSLKELDLTQWRNQIAWVGQDVYLFDASVKENIAYGRLNASNEEVMEAARDADAHEFISQLPSSYDTQIGARGVRLSGGQQQRISLARAFLRKPAILILDEPTSVLDVLSEHLIQQTLEKLGQKCTVIVIAHRLSTIKRADHIVVLDKGRVCEEGNLQELLARDGLFARLHELQL